jgi:hypothetical protein
MQIYANMFQNLQHLSQKHNLCKRFYYNQTYGWVKSSRYGLGQPIG